MAGMLFGAGELDTSGAGDAMDALEMLELGVSREVLSEKCASPQAKGKKWEQCFMVSEDKDKFAMYEDSTGNLLLTAKRHKSDFYISQYEDFPHTFEGPEVAKRFCGVLRLNAQKTGYKLFSSSCELCDAHLHKFTCSSQASSSDERQLLATIGHSIRIIKNTDIEARHICVSIPPLVSGTERVVWCPRTMSGGVDTDTAKTYHRLKRHQSSANSNNHSNNDDQISTAPWDDEGEVEGDDDDDDDDNNNNNNTFGRKSEEEQEQKGFDRDEYDRFDAEEYAKRERFQRFQRKQVLQRIPRSSETEKLVFATKLPSWNEDLGSLVLQFRNRRVLMASSKNVMLCDPRNPSKVTFQLGKVQSGRFNLDFKHPISPLQAFGIALSAHGFTCKPK